MHWKSRVSSAITYDCSKLDDSGIRKTWLHCIGFEKKFRLNEVIPHCTRSVNCHLSLQHFNEYHAYEYSLLPTVALRSPLASLSIQASIFSGTYDNPFCLCLLVFAE